MSKPMGIVHTGLVRIIFIFAIHMKEYTYLYVAKYVKCVFMVHLVFVTNRSNWPYYLIFDTSTIRHFSRFPNVAC